MWLWLQCSAAAAAAKSLQSCPTLCDSRDSSLPGSPVPGILQARTLEWVAISFSNGWKWKVKVKSLSRVWLFTTPWTAGYQAPPSMGFSRQEHWSGVPSPSPGSNAWLSLNPCEPMDYSLPGFPVHEILQARILSGLPCPPPGNLLNPWIEPASPASPALAGRVLPLVPCGSPKWNH